MASSEKLSSDDSLSTSPVAEENRRQSQVQFSNDEVALIVRMYNLVGDRWSIIAGRIPGRTAEEIKNYWMTQYSTNGFEK